MLSSMLKEHRRKRNETNQQIERKRQAAIKALHQFNNKFMEDIDSGVAVAYQNQCKVNADMKKLQVESARFMKLSQNWTTELDKFQTALKELGDVKSWSASMERDLEQIVDGLTRMQAADDEKSN